MDFIDQLTPLIAAIHAAPRLVALDFAGAGAQALTWLHSVPGSSRTILEATDRYAAASLSEAIGFAPEQFASVEVARALAIRAYSRACWLAGPTAPVAGLGCTAAIATDHPKRGEHRVCLAVCNEQGLTTYTLTLTKGRRARQGEENLVSLLVVRAAAAACGVIWTLPLPLVETEQVVEEIHPLDWLACLLEGEINWLAMTPDNRTRPGYVWPGLALLSGAFNPLHQGHRQLAQTAGKILGQEVYFELPLVNADKAPLNLDEARRRTSQFAGVGTVILTRAPLFSQKARLFPRSVFVVGADTAERLWQPRFYHHDPVEMYAAFNGLREAGCRFLVAGRVQDKRFVTLTDLDIPAGYQDLFEAIYDDDFRLDISSTALRAGIRGK